MEKLWTILEENRLYRSFGENKVIGKLFNRETISYIIAGMMTTLLGFTIFGVFLWIFNENNWFSGDSPGLIEALAEHPWLKYVPNLTDSLRAFAAEIFSAFFALTFSFIANKVFVFKSKSWKVGIASREMAGFVSSRLLSLLVETTAVVFLVSFLSANIIFAKIVGTVLAVILNYVLSKTVVFRKTAL